MLKRLLCWMGWHRVKKWDSFDGASAHATCAWCGYEGLIDSGGNLF